MECCEILLSVVDGWLSFVEFCYDILWSVVKCCEGL